MRLGSHNLLSLPLRLKLKFLRMAHQLCRQYSLGQLSRTKSGSRGKARKLRMGWFDVGMSMAALFFIRMGLSARVWSSTCSCAHLMHLKFSSWFYGAYLSFPFPSGFFSRFILLQSLYHHHRNHRHHTVNTIPHHSSRIMYIFSSMLSVDLLP